MRADPPANARLRRYFEGRARPGTPLVARPEEVSNPYFSLGTHPDLVERLWKGLTPLLPVDCRYVYCGSPVLMHPETGVVFGFAGGTHTYALRLPVLERAAAEHAGAKRVHTYPGRSQPFDLDVIGDEWLFLVWRAEETTWCLAAYEFAALNPDGGR